MEARAGNSIFDFETLFSDFQELLNGSGLTHILLLDVFGFFGLVLRLTPQSQNLPEGKGKEGGGRKLSQLFFFALNISMARLHDTLSAFFERELALAREGTVSVFVTALLPVLAMCIVTVMWFDHLVHSDEEDDLNEEHEPQETAPALSLLHAEVFTVALATPSLSFFIPSTSTSSMPSKSVTRRAPHKIVLSEDKQAPPSRSKLSRHALRVEIPFCSLPTASRPSIDPKVDFGRSPSHGMPTWCSREAMMIVKPTTSPLIIDPNVDFGRSPSAPSRHRPMCVSFAAMLVKSMTGKSMSELHHRSRDHKSKRALSSNTPPRHSPPSQPRPRVSPQQGARAKQGGAQLSSSSYYYAEVVKRQHEKSRAGVPARIYAKISV